MSVSQVPQSEESGREGKNLLRKSGSKKVMGALSLRSMSRDMLKRNKSLLKIINDQKAWSKKEVKQIR